MKKRKVDNRKVMIFENWLRTQNKAETGRTFGVTREYVRQVVEQLQKQSSQV